MRRVVMLRKSQTPMATENAWDAEHYLRFGDERTRPAEDLVRRVAVDAPGRVIDLGCGPGNSTEVLRRRWPDARVIGLDKSPEMIAAARSRHPECEWILGAVETWTTNAPFDVVFSNAAFQWMGDHERLIGHVFEQVADAGALAFQIPSDAYAAVRRHMHEVAEDPAWRERMAAAKVALTMEAPGFYYDVLAGRASRIDIWETEYSHVMDGPSAIVDWVSTTGLRPFLAALEDEIERRRFLDSFTQKVSASYPRRRDGNVLFPFRRLFVVAYR
jgi:trans-aconitate 2-methyltransferase